MQIVLNGKPESIVEPMTVAELLRGKELAPIRVAVEINEELIPRRTFVETILRDGDRVEIVTFVGGG